MGLVESPLPVLNYNHHDNLNGTPPINQTVLNTFRILLVAIFGWFSNYDQDSFILSWTLIDRSNSIQEINKDNDVY
jgi:hypothetical protein